MTFEMIFDSVLTVMLVWLCWRALSTPDLFKAVVLFIVFGLLMALAWIRLQATDIALAEAAIGAGLAGALMLDAVGQITGRPVFDRRIEESHGEEGDHRGSW